jgi:YD repeat-containing protein
MRRHLFALAALALGCGALEQPGSIGDSFPNNRTGPFRALDDDELDGRRCLTDSSSAPLRDPEVTPGDDGALVVVATADVEGATQLQRLRLDASLRVIEGPTALLPELRDVRAPSIARDGARWVLTYDREGRIEGATSDDGRSFSATRVPLLTADPREGELDALRAPSLTQHPDGSWWLAYESDGQVWLARGAGARGPFTRVDTDPARAGRQPVLASGNDATGLRRHANPTVRVERTGAGRFIWRVFATTRTEAVVDAGLQRTQVISLAASYDGQRFTPAAAPALVSRAEPEPDGPAALFVSATQSLMLFTGSCGGSRRGIRAAVYPADVRLPLMW